MSEDPDKNGDIYEDEDLENERKKLKELGVNDTMQFLSNEKKNKEKSQKKEFRGFK